jgi:hypothetical protein
MARIIKHPSHFDPSPLFELDREPNRNLRGDLIGTADAAKLYRPPLHRTQVWRYIRDGKLPYIEVGGEEGRPDYLLRREDVLAHARQKEADRFRKRIKELKRLWEKAKPPLRSDPTPGKQHPPKSNAAKRGDDGVSGARRV